MRYAIDCRRTAAFGRGIIIRSDHKSPQYEQVIMLELNLPRQFNAAAYFVDRNVEEGRGDKIAVIHENRQFTYRQVQQNVNRTANMLADLGVQMENRVMLLLRDTPEMIFGFYGAIKLGAVAIPSNILMKGPDFLYMLNDSRAAVPLARNRRRSRGRTSWCPISSTAATRTTSCGCSWLRCSLRCLR